MTKIYTRTGDQGSTFCAALRSRISKASDLIELVGTIDEAVSSLGYAKSLCVEKGCTDEIIELLGKAQVMVFYAGFALSGNNRYKGDEVSYLESIIDRLMDGIQLKGFIIPGTTLESAAIHVARTIVRRLERRYVSILEKNLINKNSDSEYVLRVLNRLSDALFAAAVYIEYSRNTIEYV